jgi:hypothetical protein
MFVRKGVGLITDPFFLKYNLYICPMTYTEDINRFRTLQTKALQKRVEELEAKLEILINQIQEYELYK